MTDQRTLRKKLVPAHHVQHNSITWAVVVGVEQPYADRELLESGRHTKHDVLESAGTKLIDTGREVQR